MTQNKPLPSAPESERIIIGTVYLWPETLAQVLPIVDKGDFYNHINQLFFDALTQVIEQHGTVDGVMLANHIGDLKPIGGVEAISKLGDWSATRATLRQHCETVKGLSNQRKMIRVAEIIVGSGYESKDPQDYVRRSLEAVSAIATQTTRLAVKPMSDGFSGLLREIYSEKPPGDVVLSHLGILDLKVGGFTKGLVTVLAGGTSMGKSLVALNLSLKMATAGTRVFYATLEDNIKNQQRRALSIKSSVPLNELKRCGIMDPAKCQRIANAASVGQLPIDWCDMPTTADQLCQLMLAYKCQHSDEDVVFIVDHLLYLRSSRRETEYERVTNAVRSLADLAKSTYSPVIALCQLNRDVKNRAGSDKAPMMSDLRSSGAIEQDARLIIGVHRPWKYDKEADPSLLELHFLKNTDGPAGFQIDIGVDLPTVSIYEQHERY
jgi:replicative DNA helicase